MLRVTPPRVLYNSRNSDEVTHTDLRVTPSMLRNIKKMVSSRSIKGIL